jgi:predicted dehydrogenase/threonine dehydrogenase-like Zn-dependent dehydrogenase
MQIPRDLSRLGYSSAGVVIDVGKDVTDVVVGERVACAGESANHAEIISVPRNLVTRIPAKVGLQEAAFTAVGSIAIHAFRRSQSVTGNMVGVVGLGLVGQLVAQVAKASGCCIIGIDNREDRIKLAKAMGIEAATSDSVAVDGVHAYTEGRGLPAVIVCASGKDESVTRTSVEIASNGGRIVIVGDIPLRFDRQPLYEKELNIIMSRSYGPGRYDPAYEITGIDYPWQYVPWTENRNMVEFLRLLENGKVAVRKLIGGIFRVEHAMEAYLALGETTKPAVLLEYSSDATNRGTGIARAIQIRRPSQSGRRIGVTLIGASSFARDTLLPTLLENKSLFLSAVVSKSGVAARNFAERFGAHVASTDYAQILEDPATDLVVIANKHNEHASTAIRALRAGKIVFVEKPPCLNRSELRELLEAVKKTKGMLAVGFNRRYSPITRRARDIIGKRTDPMVINYRVNAGRVPADHWIHDPRVGGGRVVGECCHFFDFFAYLVRSEVTTINVTPLYPSERESASDNFVSTLRWSDGSITSLTYTSIGSPILPKERIEIFRGGLSVIIDDFKSLQSYGAGGESISMRQDKGHREEFRQLANFAKGEDSELTSFEESARSMEITFLVDEAMRKQK